MNRKAFSMSAVSLAGLMLVIAGVALASAHAHRATAASMPQCRFDPSGYFYLKGNLPDQFSDFSYLALWKYSRENEGRPTSGVYGKRGEVYTLTALTAEWSDQRNEYVFQFTTAAVK